MIGRFFAAIILVSILSVPGIATAQKAKDCLQTWTEGGDLVVHNICDRHILWAWGVERGNDGYDQLVCGQPPQYYRSFELLEPETTNNAPLKYGLHWGVCFSPEWPVTNPGWK